MIVWVFFFLELESVHSFQSINIPFLISKCFIMYLSQYVSSGEHIWTHRLCYRLLLKEVYFCLWVSEM